MNASVLSKAFDSLVRNTEVENEDKRFATMPGNHGNDPSMENMEFGDTGCSPAVIFLPTTLLQDVAQYKRSRLQVANYVLIHSFHRKRCNQTSV